MPRRFYTLDVFTNTPLAGNPLAVVLDAEGLDTSGRPSPKSSTSRRRSSSGHRPTRGIGRLCGSSHRSMNCPSRAIRPWGRPCCSHSSIARRAGSCLVRARGEGGDPLLCRRGPGEGPGPGAFLLPRLGDLAKGSSSARAAVPSGSRLGRSGSTATARHAFPRRALRSRASRPLDVSWPRQGLGETFDAVFGDSTHPSVYVYAREDSGFRARMFFRAPSLAEDSATGSAAAAFAGALMQFEPLGDGEHDVPIRQGVEMGRPSEIALQVVIEKGALVSAEIGGGAVGEPRRADAVSRTI